MRSSLILVVLSTVLVLAACSDSPTGGGGGEDDLGLFPPQEYSDDFDSGRAGRRWGCSSSGCSWEVVSAGPLAPVLEPVSKDGDSVNFVFQSPDPLGQNPDRWSICDSFYAKFDEDGTFAFNYFLNTAGPVGPQGANELRVVIYSHTVEYDEDLQADVIIGTEIVEEWSQYGRVSSRFYRALPPGHYEFEFCYERNRSADIGADYVQIDDVQTCIGTSCIGEIPQTPRCRPDEGQTLVPDIDALPIDTIAIKRVQGTSDRYYVIMDTEFLEFISEGLSTTSEWDDFRSQIDDVLTKTYVDGTTCEIDERMALRIELTTSELIDYVIDTGIITAALDEIEQAFYDAAANELINSIVQGIYQKIVEWAIKTIVKAL